MGITSSERTEEQAHGMKSGLKETRSLVRGLMSRYLGERIQAQDRLKEMGPEAVDALLALIAWEQKKLRIRRRVYYGIVGSWALIGVPLMVYMVWKGINTGGAAGSGMIGGAMGGILGGWGGGLVGGTVALLFPSQIQIAASSALALVEDTRAVGPLGEAVVSKMNPSIDSRISAAVALLKLLPQIDQEDYELLTAHQRACLYRLLREPHVSKETELVLAVIEAIERAEDTRALPAVIRLAETSSGDAVNLARCHNAAVKCRDRLLDLEDRLVDSESLVRPAQSPEAESSLLRAAASTETPEELLLRAYGGDANESPAR